MFASFVVSASMPSIASGSRIHRSEVNFRCACDKATGRYRLRAKARPELRWQHDLANGVLGMASDLPATHTPLQPCQLDDR